MATFTADEETFITMCRSIGVTIPPPVPDYPTIEEKMREGREGSATAAGIAHTLDWFAGRLSLALEADPDQWGVIKGVFLRVAKARTLLMVEYRARQREVRRWLTKVKR